VKVYLKQLGLALVFAFTLTDIGTNAPKTNPPAIVRIMNLDTRPAAPGVATRNGFHLARRAATHMRGRRRNAETVAAE
jgi:hypothetical protein